MIATLIVEPILRGGDSLEISLSGIARPMHHYDKSSKWLIQHHGDSILRLAGFQEIASWQPLPAELVQPRKLPDGLVEFILPGENQPDLVLLEIATRYEHRLIEWPRNLLASRKPLYLQHQTRFRLLAKSPKNTVFDPLRVSMTPGDCTPDTADPR